MRTKPLLLGLLLLILLLVPPEAFARSKSEQALKDYKKAVTRVLLKQKTYEAKDLDRDLRRAYATFIQPWLDRNKPDAPKEIDYDFTGYKETYEKWIEFEIEKGKLAIELAKASGGEDVAKRLVTHLLDLLSEIYKQTLEMKDLRPKNYTVYDQEPAIYRYGAYLQHDLVVQAIGTLTDDEAIDWILEDGFKLAERWEKPRKTDMAKIALLDALALTKTAKAKDVLQEALESPDRRVRIVAVEGLAKVGVDPEALRARLVSILLTDPCFAVRVATLETLGREVSDPRLVPPLAQALEQELLGPNGVMRSHLRNALIDIVGRDLGAAPESWTAWFTRNREAIEAGTWQKGEDQGKKPDDEKDSVAFYDIRTLSKRFVILVDASDTLITPVDIDIAKTKNFFEWNAMGKKEREKYVSQYDLLKKETLKTVEKLPPSARFQIIIMNKSSQLFPFDPRGMAAASEEIKKRVEPWLDDVVVGGWAPQIQGIWAAYAMAGADPWKTELPDEPNADTFFLLSDGVPCGGQLMYGPALVDEVRRQNRFMRIQIHTIRIANCKDTAEDVMKGVAEATGGTYVFRTKP